MTSLNNKNCKCVWCMYLFVCECGCWDMLCYEMIRLTDNCNKRIFNNKKLVFGDDCVVSEKPVACNTAARTRKEF